MREILCRGFYENKNGTSVIKINGTHIKGEWVYWNVFGRLTDSDGEEQTHKRIMDSGVAWTYDKVEDLPVIHETIEQYTGLTDKTGKKIFEGDILGDWGEDEKGKECLCYMGVVHYWEREGKYVLTDKNGYYNDWTLEEEGKPENWEKLIIIGNIHDNLELLQEE